MRPRPLVAGRVQEIDLPPFDPLNVRAAQLRAEGHRVISLGQALPYFAPPDCALDAARRALGQREVNLYSTDPGLVSLRGALAARLAETIGVEITPRDLVITAGANQAFTLALTTLVNPGSEVVLPAPYFTNHHMAVSALGAIPVEAPIADRTTFSVHWSDIAPHVTARTQAVVLCNPSNPTGATIDAPEGARIISELAGRGIAVISDETYMHFVYEGTHWSAASAWRWRELVVVLGSFSKSFGMMGWRVGYMLADRAICAEAVKVQDAMIICAPVISQIAAEAAVREAWTYPLLFHDELRRRRRLMAEELAGVPNLHWVPARGGLFAFVRSDGCRDSTSLSHELLEREHVVTIPGAAFGPSGEGFLRFSYGCADTADLTEAVRRLRRYFDDIASGTHPR